MEVLSDEAIHCEACHISFQLTEGEGSTALPSLPVALCARCLSSLLPTPLFAVELHMTVENLVIESAPGKISTNSANSFKYKYTPPTDTGGHLKDNDPLPHVAAAKSTLKIEQHCWAVPCSDMVPACCSSSPKSALSLSLLNANYYETQFSQRRKKSVRFASKDDDGTPVSDTLLNEETESSAAHRDEGVCGGEESAGLRATTCISLHYNGCCTYINIVYSTYRCT